jgi:hypothetical protein
VWDTVDDWGYEPDRDQTAKVAQELIEARRKVRKSKGGASEIASASGGVTALAYDTSESKPPEWVWENRYVEGYLSLIMGEEKVGKGVLAAWTIARLTRGELPGAYEGKPSNVAVIADEDSWKDVWVPRLFAADVDGERVVKLEATESDVLDVKAHGQGIVDRLKEHDVKLLYVDALDDLLAQMDVYNAKEVRNALRPLRRIADELGVAVVGSKHPNKTGNTMRELMSGSAQFMAAARANSMLAKDPNGEEDQRILAVGPGNLARDTWALRFRIVSKKFELNGHDWDQPLASEFEKTIMTTSALIEASKQPKAERAKSDARVEAGEQLRKLLKDGDWMAVPKVCELLKEIGSRQLIEGAAKDVGLEKKSEGMPLKTYWRLPA